MNFYADNYELLTDCERRLLHYILDNKEQVINMTASKVASQCSVSKTVLINMAQKLGFEGYNDLRFYLKNQRKITAPEENTSHVEAELLGNVSKTLKLNKKETLEALADEILSSSCVYVFARGNSKFIGNYLAHLLLTLNVKAIMIPDINLLSIIIEKMHHDELMISLSLSGKTAIMVDSAKMVKAHGHKLVSITSFTNNEMDQYSDISVYCASDCTDTKTNDTVTRIGMLAAVDLIVHHVKLKALKKLKG